MQHLFQTEPRWKNKKLGTCTDTIGQSGCFITSLAMLADKLPDEVNDILRDGGGYSNGCLVIADKAAELLGLEYNGKSFDRPDYDCIIETNYYAPKVPQHFCVLTKDGILDPLGKNINYPIVSYRLFKGNTMSGFSDENVRLILESGFRQMRLTLLGKVDEKGLQADCDGRLAQTKTGNVDAVKDQFNDYMKASDLIWQKKSSCNSKIKELEAEQIKIMQEQEEAIQKIQDGCKAKIDDLTKQWITNNSYDLTDWRTCLGLLLKAIFKK